MVLKLRSVKSIVIAPAKTGKEINNKKDVIKSDQTYSGNLCMYKPGLRILKVVVIKLMAPKIEAAPDMM